MKNKNFRHTLGFSITRLFFEKGVIFRLSDAPKQSSEKHVADPNEVFRQADDTYKTFDDQDLSSIQGQLSKYSDSWVNTLPAEKKAEATRQWAYCLFMKLGVRRANEHDIKGYMALTLAIQSPKTHREFKENQMTLKEVQVKFRHASRNGNDKTKGKAAELLGIVEGIMRNMQQPQVEVKEERLQFALKNYLKIEAKHQGWNIDAIKIVLTEKEERVLAQAKLDGYSLATEGRYDGKAGGNLVLYKNGSPVKPKKVLEVTGLFNRINGFSID